MRFFERLIDIAAFGAAFTLLTLPASAVPTTQPRLNAWYRKGRSSGRQGAKANAAGLELEGDPDEPEQPDLL